MFTKDELMLMKNTELSAMCKERNIPVYNGKNHINKTAMVERLLNYKEVEEKPVETENKSTEIKSKAKPVIKASEKNNSRAINPVVSPVEKEKLNEMIRENEEKENVDIAPWVMGGLDEFIEKAEVGTLMAFIDLRGKPRTAKMENRSSARRVVKLRTEFDWEFIVPYDNILWVKNGPRWPRAIYSMLKEYKNGKPANVIFKNEKED